VKKKGNVKVVKARQTDKWKWQDVYLGVLRSFVGKGYKKRETKEFKRGRKR